MTELENCLNAVERIVEYTELDHEDLFEESDDDFEDINEFDLKFEKLSLSHGDILRPVVHNVNFQIPQVWQYRLWTFKVNFLIQKISESFSFF